MLWLYLFSICPTSSRKNEEYVAGLSGASSKPPEQSMQNITQNFNRKGLCKNLEAQTWMPAVSQALTQWARVLSSWTSQGQCKKIKRKLRNMNLIKPTNPNTHHELSQKLKKTIMGHKANDQHWLDVFCHFCEANFRAKRLCGTIF